MPLFTGMTTLFYSHWKTKHLTGNHERVVTVISFAQSWLWTSKFLEVQPEHLCKEVQMLTLSKSKYLEAGNLYKNIFPLDLSNTMSSARLYPGALWPTMWCVCFKCLYSAVRVYLISSWETKLRDFTNESIRKTRLILAVVCGSMVPSNTNTFFFFFSGGIWKNKWSVTPGISLVALKMECQTAYNHLPCLKKEDQVRDLVFCLCQFLDVLIFYLV